MVGCHELLKAAALAERLLASRPLPHAWLPTIRHCRLIYATGLSSLASKPRLRHIARQYAAEPLTHVITLVLNTGCHTATIPFNGVASRSISVSALPLLHYASHVIT